MNDEIIDLVQRLQCLGVALELAAGSADDGQHWAAINTPSGETLYHRPTEELCEFTEDPSPISGGMTSPSTGNGPDDLLSGRIAAKPNRLPSLSLPSDMTRLSWGDCLLCPWPERYPACSQSPE